MRSLALGLMAALVAGTAQAATTTLTFDTGTVACTATDGGATNQTCTTENQLIGGDYGSTSQLAVSYDAAENTGSLTSLLFTTDRFFSAGGGMAKARAAPANELSKIIFTPLSGYEVSFTSFTWDKLTATTSARFIFEVRDAADTLLFSAGNSSTFHSVNTAYFTGPLTFLFGNGGQGAVAVDNIKVDVRAAATTAVPEPSQWALMIAGFGLAGSALRGVRRRSVSAA